MYGQAIMPEQDLLNTVLADQKRVAAEYGTAVTESNCQVVREMFQTLLSESLAMQADLYYLMQEQNLREAPSHALRAEVEKQAQQFAQHFHKTDQFIGMHMRNMQPGQLYNQGLAALTPQEQQHLQYRL